MITFQLCNSEARSWVSAGTTTFGPSRPRYIQSTESAPLHAGPARVRLLFIRREFQLRSAASFQCAPGLCHL